MIAVIQVAGEDPHVIMWTGRVRLHVEVKTYCGKAFEADDGVLQVPDNWKVCERCGEKVAAAFRGELGGG